MDFNKLLFVIIVVHTLMLSLASLVLSLSLFSLVFFSSLYHIFPLPSTPFTCQLLTPCRVCLLGLYSITHLTSDIAQCAMQRWARDKQNQISSCHGDS